MKIVFVTSGLIPFPGFQGSTFATWSLILALKKKGHSVHFILLQRKTAYDGNMNLFEKYKENDIPYTILTPKSAVKKRNLLSKIFKPNLSNAYEEGDFANELEKEIEDIHPDLILFYTARAAATSMEILPGYKKIISTVDLDHVSRYERFKLDLRYNFRPGKIKKFIHYLLYIINVRWYHNKIMKSVDLVISHAYHHSLWLASKGVNAHYSPLPVADSGVDFFEKNIPRARCHPDKLVFGLVGAAKAIATLAGFADFLMKIMPGLSALNEKVDFHIFGNQKNLNPKFKAVIDKYPNVMLKGYVENIQDIFLNIDCLYVPTPLTLGFRTRIAEAFSFGSAVVCNSANLEGMPELVIGKNVLAADNPTDLMSTVKSLETGAIDIQALRKNARETYATKYHTDVTCGQCLDFIKDVVS